MYLFSKAGLYLLSTNSESVCDLSLKHLPTLIIRKTVRDVLPLLPALVIHHAETGAKSPNTVLVNKLHILNDSKIFLMICESCFDVSLFVSVFDCRLLCCT